MKTLVFIDGASCVGKTAVCNELIQLSQPCAYLDADWTRYIRPYTPMTENIRTQRIHTIAMILRNYILYEDIKYVYISWIMRGQQEMVNRILSHLQDLQFHTHTILLTCNEAEHHRRMQLRNVTSEKQASIRSFTQTFHAEHEWTLDVSYLTAVQSAQHILNMIQSSNTTSTPPQHPA